MSDACGRTRWKRFAIVLASGVTAATALGIAMAQGALAASFFVSGQKFQIGADTLTARGLSIYGMVDTPRKGAPVPVVVTGMRHAKIDGLCQSIVVPIPVLGTYTLRLTGDDGQAKAKDLFIDGTSLAADEALLNDLDIGVAAGSLTTGKINPDDRDSRFFDPNGIAQQAASATLTDVRVTAIAVSAATLNVPGLNMRLLQGNRSCF
ncbi:DUF6230 family protein [Streptomyces sp. NPDC058572]|uniref:DUF6230 family protein n=1 Tax=Streptomyces sp. NPDC058572 TaxID=3346546 RepID=UPI003660E2F1